MHHALHHGHAPGRRLAIVSSLILATAGLAAVLDEDRAAPRNLLTGAFSEAALRSALLPPGAWRPYPKASEREAWLRLPQAVRMGYVEAAEKLRGGEWPTPKASIFLDYVRDGNRSRFEEISFAAVRACPVRPGRVQRRPRPLPGGHIADGVWTICEESFWAFRPDVGAQKRGPACPTRPSRWSTSSRPRRDDAGLDRLPVGRASSGLAAPAERIRLETRRRILDPCLERDDFWWMGFGGRIVDNWNPWIVRTGWRRRCSSKTTPTAARGPSIRPCAAWTISSIPTPRMAAATRGPATGTGPEPRCSTASSCWPGPTSGTVQLYDHPLIRQIGLYIARAYIADRWYINFAEGFGRPVAQRCPHLPFRPGR